MKKLFLISTFTLSVLLISSVAYAQSFDDISEYLQNLISGFTGMATATGVNILDILTPKGGAGLRTADGEFTIDEQINLTVKVTSNGNPVSDVLVSIQLDDPNKNPISVTAHRTGADGTAVRSIKLLSTATKGVYVATATASYSGETLMDNVTLTVKDATTSTTAETPPVLMGHWKFNEGQGISAADSTGRSSSMTLTGNSWTDGKSGKAVKFSGSGYGLAQISDSSTLDYSVLDKVTVSAWVKFSSLDGQQNFLQVWDSKSNRYVLYKTSNGYLRFWSNNWDQAYVPSQVAQSEWYHVVVTYDGTSEKIYVGGQLKASSAVSSFSLSPTSAQTIYVSDSTLSLNGAIDEVKVWNKVLSADEIKTEFFSYDTGAPTVTTTISSSSPGASEEVEINAAATDDLYSTKIQLYVDDKIACEHTSEAVNLGCSSNAKYSAGTHTYYAVATDGSGKVGRDPSTGTKSFTVSSKSITVSTDKSSYDLGELVIISGTADPDTLVSLGVVDPVGTRLVIITKRSDSLGKYSYQFRLPTDEFLGVYTVSVSSSGVSAKTTFTVRSTDPCESAVTFSGSSQTSSDTTCYKIIVPASVSVNDTLNLTMDVAANFDVFVKWDGSKPSASSYDCRPLKSAGEKEICKSPEPVPSLAYYALINRSSGTGNFVLNLERTVASSASQSVLSNYPTFLQTNGQLNVIIVTGKQATAAETLPAVGIAASLGSGDTRLDSEITSVHKATKNLILVGSPCINSLVNDLSVAGTFPYKCYSWPNENFGIIYVVENAFASGKSAIVVAGTNVNDLALAGKILENYKTKLSNINNKAVKITGTSVNDAVLSSTLPPITNQCVRKNPTVTISPNTKSVTQGTTSTTYSVTITNNDNSACSPAKFYRWGSWSGDSISYITDQYAGTDLPSINPSNSISYELKILIKDSAKLGAYNVQVILENLDDKSYSATGSATLNILSSSKKCEGSISLKLSPNPTIPGTGFIATAEGLDNCDVNKIEFRKDSCSGEKPKSDPSGSCTGITTEVGSTKTSYTCPFSAPEAVGKYTYYACIDKNGDGLISDKSEYDSKILEVKQAHEIKFRNGWNMFSFPINLLTTNRDLGVVDFKCEGYANAVDAIESELLHYYNGNYYKQNDIPKEEGVNGIAFWLKTKSDCTLRVTSEDISADDFGTLERGWNQLGAPSKKVDFSTVVGNCNVASGPWRYNTVTNSYEKAKSLEPGEGYWLKVSDSCSLGSSSGLPPPPPA